MYQKKFLIEMKHGLGDCVCMLPAVTAIRKQYPNAYIAMIVNGKNNEEIFRRSEAAVNRFYYLSLKGRPIRETLKTVWQLRQEHFDYGILAIMTPKKKGMLLFKLLGIKQSYGEQFQGLEWMDLYFKAHFVDRNLQVVQELIASQVDSQPHLFFKGNHTVQLNKKFAIQREKIVVNIGGGDKVYHKGNYVFTKGWPSQYMVELVRLLSYLPYDICLLGGPLEREILPLYDKLLTKENIVNVVAKTTVGESIDFIADAVLSIGVDTGMQHIADALGVSTLSIFGPTNPKSSGAYSAKAHFVESPEPTPDQYCFETELYYTVPIKECMKKITPEMVYDRVIDILRNRKS